MGALIRSAVEVAEASRSTNEFVQFVMLLAAAKGRVGDALLLAEEQRASPRLVRVLKSAVEAGTTTSWAFATGEDYAALARHFAEGLAPYGAVDKILPDFFRVPPVALATAIRTGVAVSQVEENGVKLISSADVAATIVTQLQKAVAITVVSSDLVKASDGAALTLLQRELRKGVGAAADALFFPAMLGDSDIPSQPATGTDASAIIEDIRFLLQNVNYGSNSRLYIVVNANKARDMTLAYGSDGRPAFPRMGLHGGAILNDLPVVVSDAVSGIILLDATQIAVTASPLVADVSRHSALKLVDDESDLQSTTPTDLWSKNLVAIRAERAIGMQVLRENAIAVVEEEQSA
jgi:HK97 family phage major capsid protein